MNEYRSGGRYLEVRPGLRVLIPFLPPAQPGDEERDLPPGFPPMVVYEGVRCNYWLVLRERKMLYMGRYRRFSDDDMELLASRRDEVEEMLQHNFREDGSD